MKPRIVLTTLFAVSFGAGLLVYAALRQETSAHASERAETMKYNELTAEETKVILNRGTERAFTGRFVDNKASGTYICKHCNAPLFRSEDKFNS
jgi:Flp pilus assembly protein TadB